MTSTSKHEQISHSNRYTHSLIAAQEIGEYPHVLVAGSDFLAQLDLKATVLAQLLVAHSLAIWKLEPSGIGSSWPASHSFISFPGLQARSHMSLGERGT